jgi:sulfonate transport system substrate-binding protein
MLTRRALLAATATLPFAACTRQPELRIGFQTNGLLLAAKGRGAIEAVLGGRATVTWRAFPSGPPLLEAMSLGEIDLGGAGDTPPIAAQAAGARILYVAAQPVSGSAAAIIVPKGSSRRTAADLKGAKLAFTRASSAERFVRAALATAGLDMADIAPVNLTPTQAATAFAAGAVDAWAIWDPFLAHAEVELGARAIVGGVGLAQSTSFILANADVVAAHPDFVVAALNSLVATADWAATHRDALAPLIARAGSLSPAVAVRIAARQDLALVRLDPAIVAAQQGIADALHADGQLPAVTVAPAMWHGWR